MVDRVSNMLISVNLSADELRRFGFEDGFINEMINLQENISALGRSSGQSADQVNQNTQDIASNRGAIQTNTQNIGTNTGNITSNTNSINALGTAVTMHIGSNSQHGVTGDNVGTEDYATVTTGGVVLLAEAVTDANDSNVEVTAPDVSTAPAAYNQNHINSIVTLVNETKSDVNQLVSDLNDAIGQVNDLLSNLRDARQVDN